MGQKVKGNKKAKLGGYFAPKLGQTYQQQENWQQGQDLRQQAAAAAMGAADASQRKFEAISAAIPAGRAAYRQQAAQQMAAGRGLGSSSSHAGLMRQAAMERGRAIAQFDLQAAEAQGSAEEEAAAARVAALNAQFEATQAAHTERAQKIQGHMNSIASAGSLGRTEQAKVINAIYFSEPDPGVRQAIAEYAMSIGMGDYSAAEQGYQQGQAIAESTGQGWG